MLQDDVKNNLLSSRIWLRILLMAGYMLAVWVLSVAVLVVMIVQTVTVLITGLPNSNLQRFGALSSAYLHQVVDFLVFATEERPFPFAPFPEVVTTVIVEPVVRPEPVSPVPENMPPDMSWADDLPTDPRDLPPDQGERG